MRLTEEIQPRMQTAEQLFNELAEKRQTSQQQKDEFIRYCENQIREEKMRREMQFENSSDKVIAMEQAGIYQQTFPSDTDPDPTDEEIRRRAVTVLSKLNDTDRRIYYEHYVRRKPLRQVAAELNMTENAVSKRHVRLKEKIKRSIQSLK